MVRNQIGMQYDHEAELNAKRFILALATHKIQKNYLQSYLP